MLHTGVLWSPLKILRKANLRKFQGVLGHTVAFRTLSIRGFGNPSIDTGVLVSPKSVLSLVDAGSQQALDSLCKD